MKIKDLVEKHGDLELSEEVLKQLGIEIKVDKFEEPKIGEWFFYIDSNRRVWEKPYDVANNDDKMRFNTGNYYPSKHFSRKEVEEIAEKKFEYDKAVWELKREIERLNDGWVPNWEDSNEEKWSMYEVEGNIDYDSWYAYKYIPNWLYLKSQGLCEQLIRTHEKQLKIYFEID